MNDTNQPQIFNYLFIRLLKSYFIKPGFHYVSAFVSIHMFTSHLCVGPTQSAAPTEVNLNTFNWPFWEISEINKDDQERQFWLQINKKNVKRPTDSEDC